MTKKTGTLFFLFLANIILLGHAIIPHHHSNSLPSLVAIHGHHDEDSKSDSDEHHPENHDHNSDNDFRNCLLNQFFRTQTHSHRLDVKYLDNYNPHTDFYATLPGKLLVEIANTASPPTIPKYCLRSNYTDYVNYSCGLRAPPRV